MPQHYAPRARIAADACLAERNCGARETAHDLKPPTRDRIADFEQGRDHIDLSAIDARTTKSTLLANDAFSFIGTDTFDDVAGQLRYSHVGSFGRVVSTIIEGDTDGNGIANFQIELTGRHTLSSSDFVL